MALIGKGYQNTGIMDSYFWYLSFASVRQCKYVMDRAKIPEDEWRTKSEDLADEHKTPGARESLRAGLWPLISMRRADDNVLLCRRAPRRLLWKTTPSGAC